jgi:hypothetical protein
MLCSAVYVVHPVNTKERHQLISGRIATGGHPPSKHCCMVAVLLLSQLGQIVYSDQINLGEPRYSFCQNELQHTLQSVCIACSDVIKPLP